MCLNGSNLNSHYNCVHDSNLPIKLSRGNSRVAVGVSLRHGPRCRRVCARPERPSAPPGGSAKTPLPSFPSAACDDSPDQLYQSSALTRTVTGRCSEPLPSHPLPPHLVCHPLGTCLFDALAPSTTPHAAERGHSLWNPSLPALLPHHLSSPFKRRYHHLHISAHARRSRHSSLPPSPSHTDLSTTSRI